MENFTNNIVGYISFNPKIKFEGIFWKIKILVNTFVDLININLVLRIKKLDLKDYNFIKLKKKS